MDSNDIEYNELNDDWIRHFEKTDKLYQEFYKDNLYYVNLKYIYINSSNEIEKINQETFLMSIPNKITREEILKILKRSLYTNYSLWAILRYNIILDADDIKNFILYPNEDRNFLTVIKNIDSIQFEKTIHMLQDLNDLVIIFYEKKDSDSNSQNKTKKIYIHSHDKNIKKHKKTIKKR